MTVELMTPDDNVTLVAPDGSVSELWFNLYYQRWHLCDYETWDDYRKCDYHTNVVIK